MNRSVPRRRRHHVDAKPTRARCGLCGGEALYVLTHDYDRLMHGTGAGEILELEPTRLGGGLVPGEGGAWVRNMDATVLGYGSHECAEEACAHTWVSTHHRATPPCGAGPGGGHLCWRPRGHRGECECRCGAATREGPGGTYQSRA